MYGGVQSGTMTRRGSPEGHPGETTGPNDPRGKHQVKTQNVKCKSEYKNSILSNIIRGHTKTTRGSGWVKCRTISDQDLLVEIWTLFTVVSGPI